MQALFLSGRVSGRVHRQNAHLETDDEEQLAAAIDVARSAVGDEAQAPARRLWTAALIDQTEVAYKVFANLLETDGLRAALYSLLRRTDYRFIAIFRFQGGKATSVCYVDRQNLGDLDAGEVLDTATYCSFVRDVEGAFVTADAVRDARTLDHAARDVVRAYCGLPLVAPDGQFIGTLCHYDLVPRDPEQLDPALLVRAGRALAQSGLVPPYPSGAAK